MSDALTDIARDGQRARSFYSFLELLEDYLKAENRTEDMLQKVIQAAQVTDAVRRGYFSGSTNISQDLAEKIKLLIAGDKHTWAWLLAMVDGTSRDRLKELSPFKGMIVIHVDYGCGFVTFKGDFEPFIGNLIRQQKGWKTYDADDYLVVLPTPAIEGAEIFWLRCGIGGVDGPRGVK
jgi:hypothetical protein